MMMTMNSNIRGEINIGLVSDLSIVSELRIMSETPPADYLRVNYFAIAMFKLSSSLFQSPDSIPFL